MIGGSEPQTELASLTPPADPAPPITPDERLLRLDRARTLMREAGADALFVNAGASLDYFTGIGMPATERPVGLLLPDEGDPVLLCPRFERGSMMAALAIDVDFALWEEDEDPFALAARVLHPRRRLAADPLLPFAWGEALRAHGLAPIDATPVIDGCRTIKSAAEIALLQQAKTMTLEVHRRTARILRPGIRESEVVRFIDAAHRAIGASQGSGFCIVQFGQATAYPHGLPGDRALREGDLVLIDTGCMVEGYRSDITRTYAYGAIDPAIAEIWQLEKAAQAAAFAAARPGATCADVDAAARTVVEGAGLGPDYRLPGIPHRTGHGIGLSIHEAPYLVRGDTTVLRPGMCFSNEPMIVVPDRFGVRLEDHFYITEDGARWFTQPQPAIDRPFPGS